MSVQVTPAAHKSFMNSEALSLADKSLESMDEPPYWWKREQEVKKNLVKHKQRISLMLKLLETMKNRNMEKQQ